MKHKSAIIIKTEDKAHLSLNNKVKTLLSTTVITLNLLWESGYCKSESYCDSLLMHVCLFLFYYLSGTLINRKTCK